MSKKSATENFFEAVSNIKVEITKHVSFAEISDLYYNDYSESEKLENEFRDYMGKLYGGFIKEVDTKLDGTNQPIIRLRSLKRQIEDLQVQHQNNRKEGLAKINSFEYPVPVSKIDFFDRMADLQAGYITKALNYVQLPLADIEPEEVLATSGTNLKLEFNLQKNEVVALFLLLESAGFIKKVAEKDVKKFIEKHIAPLKPKGDGYKVVEGLSPLLSQIKDGSGIKPHSIDWLKQKIMDASVEMNFTGK